MNTTNSSQLRRIFDQVTAWLVLLGSAIPVGLGMLLFLLPAPTWESDLAAVACVISGCLSALVAINAIGRTRR